MKNNSSLLVVKDYSVSGEKFELIQNSEYGFLETVPQPNLEQLKAYYKSEDYISHTNSKRNIFENVYHLVRKISLKKKLKLINSYALENKKLLDVGCGTGDFLRAASQNSWNIFGIEPNTRARAQANKKTNNSIFEVKRLLQLHSKSFDVITLWHVLEHLPNLEEYISILKNLLKANGTLIIAVPNYKSYDAEHYKEFWAAYDVPRHLWHFNKQSVFKLVSKQGFKVLDVKAMWFDSFYVSMLSEKYKKGKMNVLKGFYIGLLSNLKAMSSKEASSLIYIIKNN